VSTPWRHSKDELHTYDATGQLTAADHSNKPMNRTPAYSCDDNGNRSMSGYGTGDNNQLLSAGTCDYSYDDEGNRLTRTHISSGYVTGQSHLNLRENTGFCTQAICAGDFCSANSNASIHPESMSTDSDGGAVAVLPANSRDFHELATVA